MNPVVMRCAERLLLMVMLLDVTHPAGPLPPPRCVAMESVNMKHVLRWRPPQVTCSTALLYSVQFQGEFELQVLNGSWVQAADCQLTPLTCCDLTFDLGSDSDYSVQVRAACGGGRSAWTQLSRPFNRRHTVLVVPEMAVAAVSDGLQVSFQNLPETAAVSVTVWRRGSEQKAVVHRMPAAQATLHIGALQEGAVYCVRARTDLHTQLYSSSTDAQCVSITAPGDAWRTATAAAATVVVMATLLSAALWSAVRCPPPACRAFFLKEPLPNALKPGLDLQAPMRPEEEELCEQVHVVPS